MKILHKGNLQRAEKRKEKERKKLEEKERKAREAAETVIFHCKNCGCKYSSKRDEYYIIAPTYFMECKTVTLVGSECPCCGEFIEVGLSQRLTDVTNEELKRYHRYRNNVIEEEY